MIVTGQYTNGKGVALVSTTNDAEVYKKLFGCPMIGTFNIKLDSPYVPVETPAIRCSRGHWWTVTLQHESGRVVRGWHFRPRANFHRGDNLEVMTKQPVPDAFKEGKITATLFSALAWEEVKAWLESRPRKWFQAFDWLPKDQAEKQGRPLADSPELWGHMHERVGHSGFMGRTVMDWGTCEGYFAFRASNAGASVVGVDRDRRRCDLAQIINDNIECQDVSFEANNTLPIDVPAWDYIFCLSVLHADDPRYDRLDHIIKEMVWRARAGIFLELINPPLEGRRTEVEIDEMITVGFGGEVLWRRDHPVRSRRTLYYIRGRANV